MSTLRDVHVLTNADLEREHVRLLNERDTAHNHLQRLNRELDAVRTERLTRSGVRIDGD